MELSMPLQTLDEIEQSIGGRPHKSQPKVRLSVYLSPPEARQLQSESDHQDVSISQVIRSLIHQNFVDKGN